ncbi:BON domain-containing protein [Burkholderia gladioli]|uniref:BON domain-containing protein n=1 Tax=Burkholderia gladioli TaxID=28095 RepID=UPI0016420EB6|nr:BON domain-containing protein [Burkholderia gladioli]
MRFRPDSDSSGMALNWRRRGAMPITEGPATDAAWWTGVSMMAVAGTGTDESPDASRSDLPDRHRTRDVGRAVPPAAGGAPDSRRDHEDAEIDRAVREVIAPVLDGRAGRVSILVRHARVSLEGCVPSADLRDAIGRVAGQCLGVAGVDNRIEIEPSDNAPLVLTPERRTVTRSPQPGGKPVRKPKGGSR